ncbi:unnamed protein product [Cunninghamella echinulata]
MMKSALFLFNIAALVCLGSAVDWTAPDKIQCIHNNWSSIKAQYDPSIEIMGEPNKQRLGRLLQGNQLTSNPNDNDLKDAIRANPGMADDLVVKI